MDALRLHIRRRRQPTVGSETNSSVNGTASTNSNNNSTGAMSATHLRSLHTRNRRSRYNRSDDYSLDSSTGLQVGDVDGPIENMNSVREMQSSHRHEGHICRRQFERLLRKHSATNDTITSNSEQSQRFEIMPFLVFLLMCLTLILLSQLISASMVVVVTIVFSNHDDKKSNRWSNLLHFMFSSCWMVAYGIQLLHLLLSSAVNDEDNDPWNHP